MNTDEALKVRDKLDKAEARLKAAGKRKEPTLENINARLLALTAYVQAKNERDVSALLHVNRHLKWLEAVARLADPKVGPGPSDPGLVS